MKHLNSHLNDAMVSITVKCLLNPDNKDFYIKDLTLEKISVIIDNDSSRADTFWTAFHIAREQIIEEELILKAAIEMYEQDWKAVQEEVEAYELWKKERGIESEY